MSGFIKIVRGEDVKILDKRTMEYGGIASSELMERSALAMAEYLNKEFGPGKRYCIFAGRGNNGGDGFALARLLPDAKVRVFHISSEEEMSADCRLNYKRFRDMGGEVRHIEKAVDISVAEDEILVDALFGVGINRPLKGEVAGIVAYMNSLPNPVVAVDIPSGLMPEENSANERTAVVRADMTLTLGLPKLALFFPENADFVGRWSVADIGLSAKAVDEYASPFYMLTEETVMGILPREPKFAHKGTNGCGLLIAGSRGMMGAAVLAARGALNSGIGLLKVHVPGCGADVIQMAVPEAIAIADVSPHCFSSFGPEEVVSVAAIGPGLGKSEACRKALEDFLKRMRQPLILDADALNHMAENPALLDLLPENSILTPHLKEFERLAGKSSDDFERLNKLLNFAVAKHVYVVLKGAHTIVATPDGEAFFNTSGNPGMAKGGSGDVLTGVLLALAARGMTPSEVCCLGVYIHGMAGDIAASQYGMRGVNAGYIAAALGAAWRRMETNRFIKNKL